MKWHIPHRYGFKAPRLTYALSKIWTFAAAALFILAAAAVSRGDGESDHLAARSEPATTSAPSTQRATTRPALVFENNGKAKKIVFICERVGLSHFSILRREIVKGVQGLNPDQSFNIIFFRQERFPHLDDHGFLPATPKNAALASDFLDGVYPGGYFDPAPAIEFAFKLNPDLIYILTDGPFPDNEATLRQLKELNREKHVTVDTIGFVRSSDTDTGFLKTLQQIAQENGGSHRHVNTYDLD